VGRIAGHLGLSNLIMFYDSNDIQLSTETNAVTSENVAKKYEAWNWKVITIDGNDVDAIRAALNEAKAETERPTIIIGKTVMGKGAKAADNSSFERKVSTHGQPLSAAGADFAQTVRNLGGDPENPFVIFPESKALYEHRRAQLKEIVAAKKAKHEQWAAAHPELAEKEQQWFSGKLPNIKWNEIAQKPDQATRAASATVLGYLAQHVENMIVASADLSNSDKTDGFLKYTHAFKKGDFTGAFLQVGVSELTMGALCVGMSLHGGVIPACGTFFVFSDYMKPVVRLAAIMEKPIVFIWTHDAFRVGGPKRRALPTNLWNRKLKSDLWRSCKTTADEIRCSCFALPMCTKRRLHGNWRWKTKTRLRLSSFRDKTSRICLPLPLASKKH
jgi:transketolase